MLYEVFEPYNKTKLNLSICGEIPITIYVHMEFSQERKQLYERMKEDKKHLLIRKKSFLKSILDISDIYSLRLYLTRLKERVKEQDISYNSYVPIIKLK